MSEPTARSPVPDGWDFPLDFLQDPDFLPPYVAPHPGAPPCGSGRPTREDVKTFVQCAQPRPARHAAHTTLLPGLHAIVDDREGQRHRLLPGALALTEELGNRHLLAIGPPGCGKTTQLMLPLTAALLRDRLRTVVVFDARGDQFPLLRELALQAGRSSPSIVHLAFDNPRTSIGWNPLRADLDRAGAQAIAATLLAPADARRAADAAFWRSPAALLLTEILLGLAQDATPTLPRVREIVDQPRHQLLQWLQSHGAHHSARLLDGGNDHAETCLADLLLRLLPLRDHGLCAVLSHGELDLDRLFQKPMLLVVSFREPGLDQLRPLANLLLRQLLEAALANANSRRDGRLPFPASIVADDLGPTFGAIPQLASLLHALRPRRVGVAASTHGLEHLLAPYGTGGPALLSAFASRVFFPNVEPGDAELASRAAGTMAAAQPGTDTAGPRRVFLPDEIRRPREHPILGRPVTLQFADLPTAQAYLTPSFRQARLQSALRRSQLRRPRRRQEPLTYLPEPPAGLPPAFVALDGMPPSTVAAHLRLVEDRLALHAASPPARDFWIRWRHAPGDRLAGVLRIAQELHHRGASVQDFYDAHCECGADDPEVNLRYVDYLLARRRAAPR